MNVECEDMGSFFWCWRRRSHVCWRDNWSLGGGAETRVDESSRARRNCFAAAGSGQHERAQGQSAFSISSVGVRSFHAPRRTAHKRAPRKEESLQSQIQSAFTSHSTNHALKVKSVLYQFCSPSKGAFFQGWMNFFLINLLSRSNQTETFPPCLEIIALKFNISIVS